MRKASIAVIFLLIFNLAIQTVIGDERNSTDFYDPFEMNPRPPGLNNCADTSLPERDADIIDIANVASDLWLDINGFHVVNDYAYCAVGFGLIILDISDPDNPAEISRLFFEKGYGQDVTVSGDYAYLALDHAGIAVVGISDPYHPALIGNCDSEIGREFHIAVSGDYLFTAAYGFGLKVFDISNPSSPTFIASLEYDSEAMAIWPRGMDIENDYLYILDETSGLIVYDIFDPSSPDSVGSYTPPYYTSYKGVTVSGIYAYCGGYNKGLEVVDVSNPVSPVLYGQNDEPYIGGGLDIYGTDLYLIGHVPGEALSLIKMNVANPQNPTISDSYNINRSPENLQYVSTSRGDGLAYIADAYGFQIVEENISGFAARSDYYMSSFVSGVDISGSYMYVGNATDGLRIYDISTPGEPLLIRTVDTPYYAVGVKVVGNYAYVCDRFSFQVVDITNPSTAHIIGEEDYVMALRTAVSGNYAFLAGGSYEEYFYSINITDPSNPVSAGDCWLGDGSGAADVAVSGDYAFLALLNSGLGVVDISSPGSPDYEGYWDIGYFIMGIDISGSYVYLADAWAGELYVADISNPLNPSLVGSIAFDDFYPDDVHIEGNLAYLAGESGVKIIDVSNPSRPVEVGQGDIPVFTSNELRDITVHDDYIYVANVAGLNVLRATQCFETILTRNHEGETVNDWYGYAVAGDGDLTGDAVPDYVIGAPRDNGCSGGAGAVYVYDGATGALIDKVCSPEADAEFGASVDMIPDLNGDGLSEIVVGAPNLYSETFSTYTGGEIILNGYDRATLAYYVGGGDGDRKGESVACAGDIDDGGKDDIIMGVPNHNGTGAAFVNSGETLHWDPILNLYGESAGDKFGLAVDGIGDVNNDGHDDLIVGAPYNEENGFEAGKVYIFSGDDGSEIRTHVGESYGSHGCRLGTAVAGAGDVDKDGYGDYLIGAPWQNTGGTRSGRAFLYSGYDGDLLYSYDGLYENDYVGSGVAGAGDINGDGCLDFIIGADGDDGGGDGQGAIYIYSGRDGNLIGRIYGESDISGYIGYGRAVKSAGDINSDCFGDIISGALLAAPTGGQKTGRAFVYLMIDLCNQDPVCPFICGDVNNDDDVNILDIVSLINYKYKGGVAPDPIESGDVNSDFDINILDVVYLINYKYKNGPDPDCP